MSRLTLYAGAAAISLAFPAFPASASEGGASFYLLGSGGPGAAVLPPVRGVFFDSTFYYYSASGGGGRQFVVGGNLVANLDAKIAADFATLLWVPSNDVLGGTLALGAALPIAHPDIDVGVVITGPQGGQIGVSRHDSATMIADPVASAALSWDVGGVTVGASAALNVPVGHYREGELANSAFHRWIEDFSLAATWRPVEQGRGWDISAKTGVTFNGTNHFTDYDTGTEFHAEAAIERIFSPQFSLGAQIYHFQQVTGDSGAGARLGPFEGRVTGVGATAAYNFEIGHTPVTARARAFHEFNEQNRLAGTAAFFSLTFPLHMILPPRPAG